MTDIKKTNEESIAKLLEYIQDALPIHHEQISEVINYSEAAADDIAQSITAILSELKRVKTQEVSPNSVDSSIMEKSIEEVLVSLQFQDRIRQILEHVQNDLTIINSEIKSLKISRPLSDEEEKHRLKKQISDSYTMESERAIYNQTVNHEKKMTIKVKNKGDEITFF